MMDSMESQWSIGGGPSDILVNEIILPSQYADQHRRPLLPEETLMLAVLSDAIALLYGQGWNEHARRKHLANEARAWIKDDEHRELFSFQVICQTLNIDPQALRERVLAKDPPAQLFSMRTIVGSPARARV